MKTLAITLGAALMLAQASFAGTFSYNVILRGLNEVPANASPGSGFGTVDYDDVLHTLTLNVQFQGLTGTTTASHIHCCAAPTVNVGVATTTPTFAGFPLGVTSGNYAIVLDLTQSSSFNPAFITGNGGTPASAELALAAGIAAGQAYWNIHTNTFPGGEIRGTLEAATPEPATMFLVSGALVGLGLLRRRFKA